MVARWTLTAFTLLLAGCLSAPGGVGGPKEAYPVRTHIVPVPNDVAPQNRTADEFYLVTVEGAEHWRLISGPPPPRRECDVTPAYAIDRDERWVHYDPDVYRIAASQTAVVLAVDFAGVDPQRGIADNCPTLYDLLAFSGRAPFSSDVRPDLPLRFVVEAQNGFLSYAEAYFVPMTQKIHVNYSRIVETPTSKIYVTGDFEVANLGVFAKAALAADRR